MNADPLLLQNWQAQGCGGLDAAELGKKLTESQQKCVADWFQQAQLRAMVKQPVPDLKKCFDIASWCRFGTDTLTDFSFELRMEAIARAARRFQVQDQVLKNLITSTLTLEKCLGETS
jgi:hypothetical protein